MTQAETLDILKLGRNVFLTGAPGAGKTYVLNQYISFLQLQGVNAAITAYTGIAASHLNGRTLHSWAGLSFGAMPLEQERDRVRANRHLMARIKGAKVLIIDEVSMLHPEELDRVDFICKTARGSIDPFGGLQLICCGDFFQIPPVNQEKDAFVIDCAAWKAADMKTCYLHEQHRQGDPKLLGILDDIRKGSVSEESRALLKSRVGVQVAAPIGIARLYTHNENVDDINGKELQKLKTPIVLYDVQATGQPLLTDKLKRDNKIEPLALRIGARVMFTRNNRNFGYVNGTLGEVIDFTGEGIPDPVVLTFEKRKIVVQREEWELEENGKVKARISQIPLRLAWAITVHKSQGMTLDAAEIDLSRAFEKGMGYVALSRVKRLENISLLGLNETSLQVSDRIKLLDSDFWEQSHATEEYLRNLGPEGVRELQEEFLQSVREHDKEDMTDEIYYEPDDLPMIDFSI